MAETKLSVILDAKDNASSKIKGMETSFFKLSSAVAVGTAAYDVFKKAVSIGTNLIKDSIKDFSVQEQAIARLRAGLKYTTPEWEKGVDSLTAYASELQKVTTFGDEQIISAQGMLSTFMLNDTQIKKLTPSILDMASALEKTGGQEADLQQISILLGKAIGGEDVAGLAGALRRVGVVMTEAQTELLKTGTMEERLNAITTIVRQNFGGFAEETATTMTGKMKQMQNAISDVREVIGEKLSPIITLFAGKITAFVTSEKFTDFLNNAQKFIMEKLVPPIRDVVIPLLKEHFGPAIEAVKKLWEDHQDVIKMALKIIGIGAAGTLVAALLAAAAAINLIATALDKAIDGFKWILDKAGDIQGAMKGAFGGGVKGIVGDIGGLFGKQHGGLVSAGRPYLVGEQGPETFVPNGGGRILPNNQTGGAITVNFNNPIVRNNTDLETIINEVRRSLGEDLRLMRIGA